MKRIIKATLFLTSVLLATALFPQGLAEGQRAMRDLLNNVKIGSIGNSQSLQLKHCDVNGATARQHTRQLQAAQMSMDRFAGNEEIVFCLNDGVFVQYADGSGRRHLIARGAEHTSFSYPAWSLDGTRIAFAANRRDSRIVDLVVANADGSNAVVILTLSEGYYNSYIWSISWSWDSNYIMFTYAFNDVNLNSLFVVCTIHRSGTDFVVGPGPDRSFCQYEPVSGSNRYAYIAAGRPFYFNTDLRVSNLNGSNDVLWWQLGGIISGFTHLAWNSPTSIYTVVRYWDQYPNKEVLIRFDRSGQNTSYTLISISDNNASIWSPTVSPDKQYLYDSELSGNGTSELWLTKLVPTVTVTSKGSGAYPNWRQKIPAMQPPDKVVLQYPPNGSTSGGRTDIFGFWIAFGWQDAARAETYDIVVLNESGVVEHSIQNIADTGIELMLQHAERYFWRVRAKNSGGTGPWSDTWSFATTSNAVKNRNHGTIEYSLKQNYPNPFNPTTTIEFSIPHQDYTTLEVYDATGKRIEALVSEMLAPGTHYVDWNGGSQPSGVYFYRLVTKEFTATKKFVLIE